MLWFILLGRPFFSEVELAAVQILTPSACNSFEHFIYPFLTSRTIFITMPHVCPSTHLVCRFRNSVVSPFACIGQALSCQDASSVNVTKYIAPPTDVTSISATSLCTRAPGRICWILRDLMRVFVIVPSTQGAQLFVERGMSISTQWSALLCAIFLMLSMWVCASLECHTHNISPLSSGATSSFSSGRCSLTENILPACSPTPTTHSFFFKTQFLFVCSTVWPSSQRLDSEITLC